MKILNIPKKLQDKNGERKPRPAMEELIQAINKLQDVFNTLNLNNPIELPVICMIGSQSTGKSSVLESIVRKSFLPRGIGIVTRRPLILQLIHCEMDDTKYRTPENGTDSFEEWAEFLHRKSKIYTDFDEVCKEIEYDTDLVAGTNKGICPKEIRLTVYSPNVVNLTLVDLPGFAKVPVGDQPYDIENQIKSLVMHYIENEKSIILAVSAANTDLATSESLKFAREVDPNGERTLAVLTKIDIMDRGTNANDALNGSIIPVKLGIVGIINRSQEDVLAKKTIEEQLINEKKFFETNYKTIAHTNGVPYLAKTLSRLLMDHIRFHLPKLKQEISAKLSEYRGVFEICGEEVKDREKILIRIITNLTNVFCGKINGKVNKFYKKEQNSGGATIRKVFDENFVKSLGDIEPEMCKEDIIAYIRHSGGPRASVFAPEEIFESLINEQIARLREPAIECVNQISSEMEDIIKDLIKYNNELIRFPKLAKRAREVLLTFLAERLPIVKESIDHLIDSELSCINTNHPDFSIEEALKDLEKDDNSDDDDDGPKIQIKLPSLSSLPGVKIVKEKLRKKKEQKHAEVIEKLIKNYFPIVKKTVEDQVPKIVMFDLINYMKENVQTELMQHLYKDNEKLLKESLDNVQRRNNAEKMIEAFKIANETINQVYEIEM